MIALNTINKLGTLCCKTNATK